MHLYFAGESYDDITRAENVNTLKSFAYRPAAEKVLLEGRPRFFLDSGAFTAFAQGKTVNIEEYAAFIKAHKDRTTVAANLDAIGDHQKTRTNQERLEELGCEVLPVFHHGEPWEVLEWYLQRYNYIALGGLVPIAKDRKRMTWFLDSAFSRIKDRALIHGFGVNALWAWQRYPFYSVDATSWLAAPRLRTIATFNGTKMQQHRKQGGKRTLEEYQAHTVHYRELAKRNLIQYRNAANQTTDLWKARGISFPDHHGKIKR